MGSNRDDGAMISGSQEAGCSDATVEIKIKTLDSKTYTLQVDKHVPVLALKEHIATVTGIDSEEQHLLCRGKVLKDDQLLSAFYVEDGHSLYLVVRQPTSPSSVSLLDFPATYPASSAGNMQALEVTVSVVVGTFNIAEGVDELELNQIQEATLKEFILGLQTLVLRAQVDKLTFPPLKMQNVKGGNEWFISSNIVVRIWTETSLKRYEELHPELGDDKAW